MEFASTVRKCLDALPKSRHKPDAVGSIYYNLGRIYYTRFKDVRAPGRSDADLDTAIGYFTKNIEASPDAYAYINRAEVYHHKGDFDNAIKDYSAAIEKKPDEHKFYQQRAEAYRGKGDFDKAVADYSAQIKIVSFLLEAYRNRGVANFLKGDFKAAVTDLQRANRRPDAYAILYLYLARVRGGEDGKAELRENAARLTNQNWPYPVAKLYLGELSESQLLAGSDARRVTMIRGEWASGEVLPEPKCQGLFFLGEWKLASEPQGAAKHFRQAVESCQRMPYVYRGTIYSAVEYDASVAELRKLAR